MHTRAFIKSSPKSYRALAALVLALPLTASSQLYWGGGTANIANGTTVAGGGGTWDAAITNWSTDASGTTYQAWSAGAVANFTVGSGANVALGSGFTPSVGGMNFTTSSVTWTLSNGRPMTFTSGAIVDTGTNTVNFNGATLSGSTGFTKIGTGLLGLYTNDSTAFSGTITHNGGSLQVRSTNAAGRAGTINVTGGTTLAFVNAADTAYGTGTGSTPLAITISDSGTATTLNATRTGGATGLINTLGALSLGARTVNFAQSGSATTSSFVFGATTLTGASTLNVAPGMGVTLGATSGSFGFTKSGAGSLTLTGNNTYTGNTAVSAGTFTLADTGTLSFSIGANGVNNAVTGTGSAIFNGTFAFDLTGAGSTIGDSWTLVSTTTKSFTSTFLVSGFTDNGNDTWSKVNGGVNYTFAEASGVLSVSAIPEPSTFAALAGLGVLGLAAYGRRRRA